MPRKILYSPEYGAGWSTWMDDAIPKRFACEYQPIIEAIEAGERLHSAHPVVVEFVEECRERFGVDYVCVLGASDLQIAEVADGCQVRIDEYDGFESVIVGDADYF